MNPKQMHRLASLINATFEETFKTIYDSLFLTAQLYKNEFNNMNDGDRAVITKNGDLYTAYLIDPPRKSMFVIHTEIIAQLYHMKFIDSKNYANYDSHINVVKNNNTLRLGESYSDEQIKQMLNSKNAMKIIGNFKKKNKTVKIIKLKYANQVRLSKN